jgi:hypothetical protein
MHLRCARCSGRRFAAPRYTAVGVPPASFAPAAETLQSVCYRSMQAFVQACENPAEPQEAVLRRVLEVHAGVGVLKRHGTSLSQHGDSSVANGQPSPGAGTAAPSSAAAAAGSEGPCAPYDLLCKLPLTTYEDYLPAVQAVLAAGREYSPADAGSQQRWEAACAELSGPPITALWCTSGTTGGLKLVPANAAMPRHGATVSACGPLGSAQHAWWVLG